MTNERKVPKLRPSILLQDLLRKKGLGTDTARNDGTCVCYALMLVWDKETNKSVPRWSVAGTSESDTYGAINEGTMTCCLMMSDASSDDSIAYENKTMPLALAILTYGRARGITASFDPEQESKDEADLTPDELCEKFAKELNEGDEEKSVVYARARVINLVSMEGLAHQALVFDDEGEVIDESLNEQWTEETDDALTSGGELDSALVSAFSLLVMCAGVVIDGKVLSEGSLAEMACTDLDLPSHLRTKILRATFLTATESGFISLEVAKELVRLCGIIANSTGTDN